MLAVVSSNVANLERQQELFEAVKTSDDVYLCLETADSDSGPGAYWVSIPKDVAARLIETTGRQLVVTREWVDEGDTVAAVITALPLDDYPDKPNSAYLFDSADPF